MKLFKLNRRMFLFLMLLIIALSVFVSKNLRASKKSFLNDWSSGYSELITAKNNPRSEEFSQALSDAAVQRTKAHVKYNGAYVEISYPGGDVPEEMGVCTDVLIRAYRKIGIDLQKNVHEDMEANFDLYPNLWGLGGTDTNIDHRRVPNLMLFFSRKGEVLPITKNPKDYLPGDIVAWNTFGLTHIGLVVNVPSPENSRYMIVHNFGNGPEMVDFLFSHKIIGHFRYEG